MEEQVYTYALVKAIYDTGEDHLDSFWPFVINVFPPNNEPVDMEYIQSQLEEKYDLQIPTHTLREVLNRAEKKSRILKKKRKNIVLQIKVINIGSLLTQIKKLSAV